MTQKVIQDIRKMGNNHRSKNISMKQNPESFRLRIKEIDNVALLKEVIA